MSKWIEFELDLPAIVKDYAKRYLEHSFVHESLDDFAAQAALDLKIPEAEKWVKHEVKKLEREIVTI